MQGEQTADIYSCRSCCLRVLILSCVWSQVDAVLCCCGIQYLVQPLEVLRECIRVLRPAGTIVISFSSHSFEQKAYAGERVLVTC